MGHLYHGYVSHNQRVPIFTVFYHGIRHGGCAWEAPMRPKGVCGVALREGGWATALFEKGPQRWRNEHMVEYAVWIIFIVCTYIYMYIYI